jgi:hypothetical protein
VLLQPAPDDLLEAIEMHPQINDSRHDEPRIHAAAADAAFAVS